MAADYTFLSQYPDTEVVGGTTTRPVQVISATSKPSGIYFEVRVGQSDATGKNIAGLLTANAVMYEALLATPGVAYVEWFQRATQAGLLEDAVRLYVTSDSGNSEAPLVFPLSAVTTDVVNPAVAALVKSLNATEAAGA